VAPDVHRPRCPRCGGLVGMQVMHTREAGGVVVTSSRCGYRYPHAPTACPQPVVMIVQDGARRYVFPDTWAEANGATLDALLRMESRS